MPTISRCNSDDTLRVQRAAQQLATHSNYLLVVRLPAPGSKLAKADWCRSFYDALLVQGVEHPKTTDLGETQKPDLA